MPEPGVPSPLHELALMHGLALMHSNNLSVQRDWKFWHTLKKGMGSNTMRSWHPRRSLHHLADCLVDGHNQMHDPGLPVACHAGALVTSEQPVSSSLRVQACISCYSQKCLGSMYLKLASSTQNLAPDASCA